MNLRFDAEKHLYYIDDRLVPGVTTITSCLPKPWAMAWPVKEMEKYIYERLDRYTDRWGLSSSMSNKDLKQIVKEGKTAYKRKADTAADKGTQAHDYFEKFVKSRIDAQCGQPIDPIPIPTDPHIKNAIELFLKWERACKPVWIASEQIVGSEKHYYGGRFDAIASIDGKVTLIDFKTSNGLYEDYYVQTAGYQLALDEMGLYKTEQRMLLWVPKTGGKFEARIVPTHIDDDKAAFLAALTIYRYFRRFENGKL